MAATVTLTVELNDKGILTRLNELDAAASKLQGRKITIGLNGGSAAGIDKVSSSMSYLTTSAAKYDAQLKAAEASAKRFSATLKESIQARESSSTYQNSSAAKYDAQLKAAEESAKRFSSALKEQMLAEQEAAKAHEGMRSSYNEYDQAIQKREAEGHAFAAALKQQMLAEREAEQEARRAGSAMSEAGNAAAQSGSSAASGASGWTVLGGAISSALGHLASRAIMYATMKIRQALRDALTEMKNVDTQLTNISKVSGKTGEELAAIGDRAYDTASKYGEAASTYLESVYNMQKAGMGDQSEAMGELAIKTMLVGDTTEDVASKFLIASNAAWQLDGNMARLGQIVDEADYINNNYATSLDKLAAGMPIVASIAAQTGMTAEETMAAIGTITAATQESGTKAATALRALILNISGEVGKYLTEEGEEFEVTEKSVKSMQGLLEKYAKTEMDAAKAAGQLIDPMTAIQAIFKGMKEDDLNDVELFNLLSGMGGKLRTNQLTALVQNFDTLYQDMMNGMKGAAGTADKEIDLMMNSWERKTQVLKNTWTEFIADVVDTSGIKGGLDWLTDLISDVDKLVEKLTNPFDTSDKTKEQYANALAEMKDLESRAGSLNGVEQRRLQLLREITAELEKQAGIQAKQDAENLNKSLLKDQWAQYDENGFKTAPMRLSGDQARLNNLYGEYRDAATGYTNTGDITAFQDGLKGIVSTYGDYYDQLVRIRDAGVELNENQEAFIGEYEGIKSASEATITDVNDLGNGLLGLYDAQGNLIAQVQKRSELEREQAERAKEAQEEQAAEIEAFEEAANAFDSTYSTNAEVEQQALDALRNEWNAAVTDADNATASIGDYSTSSTDAAAATESVSSAASGISGEIDGATASMNGLAGAARATAAAFAAISLGPMGGLLGGFGFATGTKDAPGGPTLVNELGPELISENGRAYIANGGKPGVVNLSKGAIVLTASETRDALRGGNGAVRNMHAAAGGVAGGFIKGGSTASAPGAVMFNGANIATLGSGANLNITIPRGMSIETTDKREKYERRKGNGVGGGGSSTAKSVEDLAKETKDILSNLEKQAKLADNRKQYDKEASLYGQGQKQIDKMVAAYKKAGYKETDDEVLDLLNKRYDYEKKKDAASKKTIEEAAKELKDKLSNLEKQADVAEKKEDYLSQVKFYEQAQEAIKTMVERYRKAGYKDDSDEILDLLKKNYDYADKQVNIYKDRWNELIDALETDTEQQELANALAEKQQALEDARLSLENAQKQRTIRTYNASTGQWEWVRDEAKVKSAQESLTKAEKDYADEVKDQAIQEIEKMRDTLADLNDVVLGPALTSVMAMAESSNEFQNFARALNAVYGVGSYLSSTEGSSKVISTASDSHDTIYTFGNVTLTEEQASTMSVAQLAQKLQVLKIS